MHEIFSFAFITFTIVHVFGVEIIQKPNWPSRYHVKGRLILPDAELEEPFEIWYDGTNNRSRFDFYGGVTKILNDGRIGKLGKLYALFPTTTETRRNEFSCFYHDGSHYYPHRAHSILPNITDFQFIKKGMYGGKKVHIYQLKEPESKSGLKTSKYTIYIDENRLVPLYYFMFGIDNIEWGHYDKYKIIYSEWSFDFSDKVFDNPLKGLDCVPFTGWDYSTHIFSNPIKEYIHPVDKSHVLRMHKDFVMKYKKDQTEDNEHRRIIFRNNLRYINSMNRKNLTYKLKINHLADRTSQEIAQLNGLLRTPKNERKEFDSEFKTTMLEKDIPKEFNWRLYGAVTPVKDQAKCGSCWSFGVTGTIEGTYFKKTGKLLQLSEQQLVDCSWGYDNNGCYGGEDVRAYKYIMKHGIATDEDYGPYKAINDYCKDDKVRPSVNITGYVRVPFNNVTAMKVALLKHGPVTIAMNVDKKEFLFYANGVYYDTKCKREWKSLDHQLLVVGYGTHEGEPYWLVKNSWSKYWGNAGYFLISQRDNICGILTDASFPIYD